MKRDIRSSLMAKIIAIVLLMTTASGAALGFLGMICLGEGWGTADSYYEDELCLQPMERAMYDVMLQYEDDEFFANWLLTKFQGIGVQLYLGAPEDGALLYTWGEIPEDPAFVHTMKSEIVNDVDYHVTVGASGSSPALSEETTEGVAVLPAASFYTLVGYLPRELPSNSAFSLGQTLYEVLRPLDQSGALIFAGVMLLSAVLLLIFLLCAAGHRQGCEGITPNWQDRIPLDLYLALSATGITMAIALGVCCLEESIYNCYQVVFFLTLFVLCILVAALLLLAALMTLATRFKLGKWWRSSICYRLLRWCWRLCGEICAAVRDLVRILPLTWRTVLAAGGVLLFQSVGVLFCYDNIFFLLWLAVDMALLAAAAWMSMQLQQLKNMGKALADGDLDTKLDTRRLLWDVRIHAENLNAISDGMTRAVEQKLRSERLKTELITNVSHDIKTPLTSIVNYVDLLKKEELPETAGEYVAVLDRQSRRLKKLTEDLVEASKASTGNIAVKLEPIVVNEIIHQAIGDYNEKLSAGRLDVIVNTYDGSVMALADGRLLWRVLDNLLNNVCKYALAGTRVYVDLDEAEDRVVLSMKNISRDPLYVRGEELTERFVRGDASRHTEGSGLGLNIAQSLMELMGGTFQVSVDGDLFKAELSLRGA